MELERIQQALAGEKLDGWLFYDFRKSNPIAYQILSLPIEDLYTRRWFYFVPAEGTPTALVSAVESHVLHSLPGERRVFHTWQELHAYIEAFLRPGMRVTMQYSPMNAIPYVSRVDAGTVELVRSCGVDVISSADLVAQFEAVWTEAQLATHQNAAQKIGRLIDDTFSEIGRRVRATGSTTEY